MPDVQPLLRVDTEEERAALRWSNRRWFAGRPGRDWPAGVLEDCERLDGEHPGWHVLWASGSRALGSVPTYSAQWLGHERLAGADQAYTRRPGERVRPRVLGATVAELMAQMAAMDARIIAQRANQDRLNESLRRGLR